jgi:hypothetical protein
LDNVFVDEIFEYRHFDGLTIFIGFFTI